MSPVTISPAERLAAARSALETAERRTGVPPRERRDAFGTTSGPTRRDPWSALEEGLAGALAVTGSTGVLLAAAARRQGRHGWCAVLGAEDVGWCAAAEVGLALERVLALETSGMPPGDVLRAASALLEGVDVLLLSPRCAAAMRPARCRALTARAHGRDCLLLVPALWEGAPTLRAEPRPQASPPGTRAEILALHPGIPVPGTRAPAAEPAREMPPGYLRELEWTLHDATGTSYLRLDSAGMHTPTAAQEPPPGARELPPPRPAAVGEPA